MRSFSLNYSLKQKQKQRTKGMISVCHTVKTRSGNDISIDTLYDELQQRYNPEQKGGSVAFEIFDSNDTLVKPHVDCERYVPSHVEGLLEKIIDEKLTLLSKLFNVQTSDWAVSQDCREVTKDKYKYSFHFVLKSKKVSMQVLRGKIQSLNDPDFDMSVYRSGINKFRVPYTKKDKDTANNNSLLVPVTDTTKETFKNHLISYTEDCELIAENNTDNQFVILETQPQMSKEDLERLTGEEIIGSIKQDKKWFVCDIKSKRCGKPHDSNHNFVSYNSQSGDYIIRCHSMNCQGFRKIVRNNQDDTGNDNNNNSYFACFVF